MCGIAGIIAPSADQYTLQNMLNSQVHRGPDFTGVYLEKDFCALGHNRLSIIDLRAESNQPMHDASNRYVIVFNGEVYNYLELRKELSTYQFRTQSDTEVILAAYIQWGANCLSKFIGMFSFVIWDKQEKTLFGARDRFGVKPFYYTHQKEKGFLFSSEIKALRAAGVSREMNDDVWSAYFTHASYGLPHETFWHNIWQLPAGHCLTYSIAKGLNISSWYNFSERIAALPALKDEDKMPYYEQLLHDSISLRFRADVPVGFNLSGGLDSSLLLAMIDSSVATADKINAFSFTTGNEQYDELPWVKKLLSTTHHPLTECRLTVSDVPALASRVASFQDEPFGGIPTLAYSGIFKRAREAGVIVLLDGQGMDEAWAGYDYYVTQSDSPVQGTTSSPVRPSCLDREFISRALKVEYPKPFADATQNLQYRDLFYTKIPRALRFNDRISMMYGTELREPFLDHRLMEFGFAQPLGFKIKEGRQKWMLREIASRYLRKDLVMAPKRPVQTPQREWLANELKDWVTESIYDFAKLSWVNKTNLLREWEIFLNDKGDNSFYIWQWVNTSLLFQRS